MDDTCRCCNCRFFDEMDSSCHAHPPVYAGRHADENGDVIATFRQPDVYSEWVEWCGEWEPADKSQTREQRWKQIVGLRKQWAEKHDPELAKQLNELYGE